MSARVFEPRGALLRAARSPCAGLQLNRRWPWSRSCVGWEGASLGGSVKGTESEMAQVLIVVEVLLKLFILVLLKSVHILTGFR